MIDHGTMGEKIHIHGRRYPSLLPLVMVIAGIVAADLSLVPSWFFLSFAAIGLLAGLWALISARVNLATTCFLLCLLGFGAFSYSVRYRDFGPHHVSRLLSGNEPHRIFGRVSDWPESKTGYTEIPIALDSLGTDQIIRAEGGILLKLTDTSTTLQRGDRIEFRGRIYPLPRARLQSGFDYRRYLTLHGMAGIVYLPTLLDVRVDRRSRFDFLAHVDNLRSAIIGSLGRNLSSLSAALAGGFLLGETRDIPIDIYRMFRETGTMHVLAVSGSNVALVLLFVVVLARPLALSRSWKSIVLLLVVVVFAALSYWDPSVVRASVMASLVILVRLLQRSYDLNNIIALTALIILLVEPAQLYDVGFQLSFATAWGLIFIVPRISDRFGLGSSSVWVRWLYLSLIMSVVAQICSAPIIAYYFGRIPVVSVLANLLVVPLVSAGVIGVLVLLAADLVFPILGLMVGSMVDKLLLLVVWVLGQFGGDKPPVLELPGNHADIMSIPLVVLFYLFILMLTLSIQYRHVRRAIVFSAVAMLNVVLGLAILFTGGKETGWMSFQRLPGGVLTIVSRDNSGQADLILNGLSGRDYPLEERVFQPLLKSLAIERVSSLFVHSSDYGALDDIVRLVQLYRPSSIYVNRILSASFSDALSHDSAGAPGFAITYYGGAQGDFPDSGYYSDDRGLWLIDRGSTLLFTDRVRPRHFTPATEGGQPVFVLGQPWTPAADDWIRLHRAGYRLIICSKVAQYFPEVSEDDDRFLDKVLPEYIVDLQNSEYLTLPL